MSPEKRLPKKIPFRQTLSRRNRTVAIKNWKSVDPENRRDKAQGHRDKSGIKFQPGPHAQERRLRSAFARRPTSRILVCDPPNLGCSEKLSAGTARKAGNEALKQFAENDLRAKLRQTRLIWDLMQPLRWAIQAIWGDGWDSNPRQPESQSDK